jgi:hypothetical protein
MTDPIATDLLPEFEARGRALANIARVLCIPECSPAELAARVHTGFAATRRAIAECHEALDIRNVPGTNTKSLLERIELLADAKSDVVSDLKDAEAVLDAIFKLLDAAGLAFGSADRSVAMLIERLQSAERNRDDIARKLGLADLYRAGLVASQLERAEAERDDIRATLAKCHTACNSAGIAIRTDVSERVHHMAAELASLREKVQARLRAAGPVTGWWEDSQFIVDGDCAYSAYDMGAADKSCVIRSSDKKYVGYATSLDSARRLAELLAGFDPGGIWRVAGDPVTVAVVRAVCPNTAVAWSAA